MARSVLGKGGGFSLSEDIKVLKPITSFFESNFNFINSQKALAENLDKLRRAILEGKIGKEALAEYKKILKQTLARIRKFHQIIQS